MIAPTAVTSAIKANRFPRATSSSSDARPGAAIPSIAPFVWTARTVKYVAARTLPAAAEKNGTRGSR